MKKQEQMSSKRDRSESRQTNWEWGWVAEGRRKADRDREIDKKREWDRWIGKYIYI